MPFLPLEHPEALAAIGALLPNGTRLLSGGLRLKKPVSGPGAREAYNSLMVFGDQGNLEQTYDKIHLVPFGEYLPMQSLVESIGLEQLTRWRGALRQAYRNRAFAHASYVVLPQPIAAKALAYRDEFEKYGVGLCTVELGRTRVLIAARDGPPLLQWLSDRALATFLQTAT